MINDPMIYCGLGLIAMMPDYGADGDFAKLGLGGAIAIVFLTSLWLNYKEKTDKLKSDERIAQRLELLVKENVKTNERLSVLIEKLDHKPCLLHKQ